MKKLLFVGALLLVGATSFGAVSQVMMDDTGAETATTGLKGKASIMVSAQGNIIDATGKAVLVVTPTLSAGPNGDELLFDFIDLVKGETQSLTGRFTAQVVNEGTKDGQNIFRALSFGEAKVAVTLEDTGKTASSSTVTDNGTIPGIKLYDKSGADPDSSTEGVQPIGSLSYQLKTTKTSDDTYTGIVTASVKADAAGSFINKDALVTVEVTNFSYTPLSD